MDAADIMLVTKKTDPSLSSGRLNLRLKKLVIHELSELAWIYQ